MSFSLQFHKSTASPELYLTLCFWTAPSEQTTCMYEDTIYIALPIANGKYNILQLFHRMNLQKIICICTNWHFIVHVATYTAVCQLVT
jgi:hypothetical protein